MTDQWQRCVSAWNTSRIATRLRDSQFLRFLLSGGLNTLFGYSTYAAGVLAGAPLWLALLGGMLAGSVFNFFTTGGYAFRQLSAKRYPRFLACYLLLYGVNLALIGWMSAWIGNALVTQALLTAPLALLSYFMMARLVFATHD